MSEFEQQDKPNSTGHGAPNVAGGESASASSANPPKAASTTRFVFPRWANYLLPAVAVLVVGGGLYVPVLFGFGASPVTTAVGYAPKQPIPYSHALHVGQLGLDCRYCHNTVEKTAFASLPPTQTCMNCHSSIKTDSDLLQPLRDSWSSGRPVEWVRVHALPEYVYFNHSAHVNHGVGCVECHGRIDHMDVVQQAKPLSMGWCLECHRDPNSHLRPLNQVTNLAWDPDSDPAVQAAGGRDAFGAQLAAAYKVHDKNYMQSCSTCHR